MATKEKKLMIIRIVSNVLRCSDLQCNEGESLKSIFDTALSGFGRFSIRTIAVVVILCGEDEGRQPEV